METAQIPEIGDARTELVTEPALAARWHKSLRTLQRMRARMEAPPWLSIGRTVFYRHGDILAYEERVRQGACQ